ncbi:MAG: beta-N-acetylhexosaminidase [Acidimicrobiales bacterium]
MTTRWTRVAAVPLALVLVGLPLLACSGDDDADGSSSDEGDGSEPDDDAPATTGPAEPVEPLRHGSFASLIPRPTELTPAEGELALVETTTILVDGSAADIGGVAAAELLRGYLGPATGLDLPVAEGDGAGPTIRLTAAVDDPGLGDEGYELVVDPDGVEVRAAGAAGFRWAVQTIRQLLAPEIESGAPQPGTFTVPAGTVRDVPRFAWRGAMLDVARHFFAPEDVQRVIDLLALYKLNRFHLHLTDDQGWRLQIEQHPELTEVGAATEVDGGPGGFYTQEQYRQLVEYAAARGIVVVPEIDVPGHTAAALASLPGLGCPGVPTSSVATGFSDGMSSLCATADADTTYAFMEDVVDEVAALTPGPYIHLGADEARATSPEDYRRFLTRAAEIVRAAGRQPIGWDEIATAELGPDTLVQYWMSVPNALAAAEQGASLIMSPASRTYLDMKYDDSTPIGLTWAGTIDTRRAYEWDPATFVSGLPAGQILGVEAPLWTETVADLAQVEQMMLPRLPGYAEIGWSAPEGRTWDEYGPRIAAHAARWTAGGRDFTRDPVVPWL